MSDEEKDIIDREAEIKINDCTQSICRLKLDYSTKNMSKQQRDHVEVVMELLKNYLKAVDNIFNNQREHRIKRDLETYKFLKLDSEKRQNDDKEMGNIHYKADMDLGKASDESSIPKDDEKETRLMDKSIETKSKKSIESETTASQSIEDDANISRQHDETMGLSAEDLQMLEIENKQLLSEFKGLNEEVQQIERHVYDIAKLQEIFTEKVRFFFLQKKISLPVMFLGCAPKNRY